MRSGETPEKRETGMERPKEAKREREKQTERERKGRNRSRKNRYYKII